MQTTNTQPFGTDADQSCTVRLPSRPIFFELTGHSLTQFASMGILSTADVVPERIALPTSGSTISPLATTYMRLRGLETLDSNWDSYGSVPPNPRALAAARSLIQKVYQISAYSGATVVPYSVLPLSGGGVQIEWRGPAGVIEIEVSAAGELGYLIAKGTGPERVFEEGNDVAEFRAVDLVRSVML